MGSFSIWHWLIVLLIIVLVFGTKKLRNIGADLGGAVKGFRKAMNDAEQGSSDPKQLGQTDAEFSESANHKHEADRHGKA